MGYHYALYFIPVWYAKKQEVVNIQQETTYPWFKSDNNLPAQSLGKKNPPLLFVQLVTFIVLLARRQSITQIFEGENKQHECENIKSLS